MTKVKAGPQQIDIRQQHREGGDAQDGCPDDALAADAVADGTAEEGAERHREQEHEQVDLRRAHRYVKFLDQIEAVVARDAGDIEIFREDQHHQDADRPRDPARRHRARHGRPALGTAGAIKMLAFVPCAHLCQHGDGEHRGERKPRETRLSVRNDDPGGEQRTHRAARIAAHLENRLRQAVAAAGSQPRNSRGFRMKDRRARPDQRRGRQHARVVRRECQSRHADQGEAHADAQGVRLRMLVRVNADERLQDRSADLIRQRDHTDLHETQVEFAFQQRIDRDDQRLHHVVEKMRETDGAQNIEARFAPPASRRICAALGRRLFKKLFSINTYPTS